MRLSKQIYDFGLDDDRMNFFMQKVVQKYYSNSWVYGEENGYAYIPKKYVRTILGSVRFEERISYLIENKYIEQVKISKNDISGNDIVGYIPKVFDYTKKKRHHKFMDNYYNNIEKNLSPIAKQILRNLRNTKINITENKFWDIVGVPEDKEKLKSYKGMLNEIKEFNSSSAKEINEYIVEDVFGKRVHTIISRLPKEIRSNYVFIGGEQTVEIDLTQSQPIILGKILESKIGNNSYSSAVRNRDIYILISDETGITRDDAKKVFYQIAFGKYDTKYTDLFFSLFPDTEQYIRNIKKVYIKDNPSKKRHSNLAFILQQKESDIFRQVWGKLKKYKVPFLTVHDSVIIQSKNLNKYLPVITNELYRHIHNQINVNINV